MALEPDGACGAKPRGGRNVLAGTGRHPGRGPFQTSDLAELKDGTVYLRGRAGDQINVAGRKVSPAAIEQVLRGARSRRRMPGLWRATEMPIAADLIVACVHGKRQGTAEELKQFLLRKLPGWQVPREWWFVKSLEANTRGKVSRAEWRDKFLERRAQENTKS